MSLKSHYIKTLFRAFKRDLSYSFINLFGLAIGLATAFLLLIYVLDELSYDKHIPDHERIFRLESKFQIKGKEDLFAATQIPLAPTLKDEYPEIESFVRIFQPNQTIFEHNEQIYQEDSLIIADSSIFTFFGLNVLKGDPVNALKEPNTIALSATLANKYFGSTNPIGQSLKTNNGDIYQVMAVFNDLPWNSHIRYNGIISSQTIAKEIGEERFNDRSSVSFWNISLLSFVKLHRNTKMESILDKFPAFYDKYMKELGDQINGNFMLLATPIADVHYNTRNLQYDMPTGNKSYLYILGFVGFFILIIASINYMNLATARSSRRAKEVGIRKVSGAYKNLIIKQFLGESVILSMAALVIAGIIILTSIPVFNEFAGKHFSGSILFQPQLLLIFIGMAIFIGLLSGLYPALYLSTFDPVKILKGISISDKSGAAFRRFLVVVQFAISAFMIIGSLIVSNQLNFMQKKELGFDKNNVVVLSLQDSTIRQNLESFKQELLKNPNIIAAGASSSSPGRNVGIRVMKIEGMDGSMEEKAINNFNVDYDYMKMMGFSLDTGRFYSKDRGTDPDGAYIINKKAAENFNWHKEALGKGFQDRLNLDANEVNKGEIVGVLSDFNYASLHNPVEPIVLLLSENTDFFGLLSIRIKPGTEKESIDWIKSVREEFQPYYPFDYQFLSDRLNEYYHEEMQISTLFKFFTLLTLFIASLGLLGLSSFMTQQKTREIGIRKVLGSTSGQIVKMFLFNFSKWVLIANIIAFPLAYYFMNKWLRDFYYRINITAMVFLLTLIFSLLVAIITVSWQSWKASRLKPAESLKYE
jgi:putative ABC transport system permease protein